MKRSLPFVPTLAGFVVATALVAAAGCGENPVPENPSYQRDIKPLMEAHCIRCHGAGGSLNLDPDIPDANTYTGAPTGGDFTALADDAAGRKGLAFYTVSGGLAIMQMLLPSMPPPPAPPLTDREYNTLVRWLKTPLP